MPDYGRDTMFIWGAYGVSALASLLLVIYVIKRSRS